MQNSSFGTHGGVTTAQLAGADKISSLNASTQPKPTLPLPERFKNAEVYKNAKDLTDKPLHKQTHPFYRTSSAEYGARPPEQQELPNKYFGNAHSFTKTFNGMMHRDAGLNTSISKSRIQGQNDPL